MYVHAEIRVSPGLPQLGVLESALGTFLAPIADRFELIENVGALDPEKAISAIASDIVRKIPYPVDVRGSGSVFFTAMLHPVAYPRTGSLIAGFDSAAFDVEAIRSGMIEAAVLLGAPWAAIWPPERARQHLSVYQETAAQDEMWFDLHRGLSGVAPVTFLGPGVADFVGVEALQSLGDDIAGEVSRGNWVLTPCAFDEWTTESWCEAEREVINVLGSEKFFDPAEPRLPSAGPTLPDRGSFPGRVHPEFGTDEWVDLQDSK